MDIFNFLFSIHDYNEVGDHFLTNWSMSMVFVCTIILYLVSIFFSFSAKKRAQIQIKKYFPDEKIIFISTCEERIKLLCCLISSFGYSHFILPFIFFKNLNHVGFLYKEFVFLFATLYSFLFIGFLISLASSTYIFTNKGFRIIAAYDFLKYPLLLKNVVMVKLNYNQIIEIKFYKKIFSDELKLLTNFKIPFRLIFHKHLKQAQKIIESYLDKDGELDYDTKKETGNSSSD